MESESKRPTGQVVWLQAPTSEDDAVRFQLQTWNPDKTPNRNPTVYALSLRHGAFQANYALLLALAMKGHQVVLTVDGESVLAVAVGEKIVSNLHE